MRHEAGRWTPTSGKKKKKKKKTLSILRSGVTPPLNRGSSLLQLSPHTPPTPSLWARALSPLPSRALLLLKPARGGNRSARRSPPSPLHFSQHGYSCNLDPLHRRIPALRGTRKVSDRHHHLLHLCCCCCSCCIQSVYVCVRACVCVFARLSPAAIVRCAFTSVFDSGKRGAVKKKKKNKQARGEKEKSASAAISLQAGSC